MFVLLQEHHVHQVQVVLEVPKDHQVHVLHQVNHVHLEPQVQQVLQVLQDSLQVQMVLENGIHQVVVVMVFLVNRVQVVLQVQLVHQVH